ncbi:MAG: hypothetical protein Q8K60_06665 [Parachlamydiaceae bacterium]|nr:hypothetical protein [Parachlamydiaceae bacterium]
MDFNNKIVELPNTFYDIKNSIKNTVSENSETIIRTINVTLPFITLYKPLGNIISFGTSVLKTSSHLLQIKENVFDKDLSIFSKPVLSNAFEIAMIAGVVFKFKLTNLVIHSINLVSNFRQMIEAIKNNDKKAAFARFLNTISSVMILSLMYRNSLKNSLISTIIQVLIQTYQSGIDWNNGNKPESISKILMAGIKIHQSYKIYELMQLKLKMYEFFNQGIKNSKNADHLKNTDLLTKTEVIKTDAEGNEYYFGQHYHGYGKGIVKGMNLEFRTEVDNDKHEDVRILSFKVNHVFRKELELNINNFKSLNKNRLNRMLVNQLPNIKNFDLKTIDSDFGKVHELNFQGLGVIYIGADTKCHTLYNRVEILVNKNQNVFDFHQLLSLLHLDRVLVQSSEEDIERMKIGHLFRVFFPKEAFYLERDEKFFELPVSTLKNEIERTVPAMQNIFVEHLSNMEKAEILPGRIRYTIPNLSKIANCYGNEGALVSTITNTKNDNELIYRTISTLKMGLISSEMRFNHGMNVSGLCSVDNFYSGGADSVFTQYVNENNLNNLDKFGYPGKVRIIFSLDLVNTGTYQYLYDNLGYRYNLSEVNQSANYQYINRLNIFKFFKIQKYENDQINEIMIKEIIPENKIVGIWIKNEELKSKLMDQLRLKGLIQKNTSGIEMINNKPVDQFIKVNSNR